MDYLNNGYLELVLKDIYCYNKYMLNNKKIQLDSALPDSRPLSEQGQDYLRDEIASGSSVIPFKNKKITKLGATIYNQWFTSACVLHAFYTLLEYEGIIPGNLSPSQLRAYRKRSNYPNEGTGGVDGMNKIREGQSFDFPTPERFRESQANAMPYVKGDKVIDFKYFQYRDENWNIKFDDVINDIARGKSVSVFIYATKKEWSKEYVTIEDENLNASKAQVRHAITLPKKGDFTEKGGLWLTVHDSSAFGGRHLRYMSYDFFMKRVFFAATVFKENEIKLPPALPKIIDEPNQACRKGDRNDSVLALQKFLVKNGMLKPEHATAYYGTLTSKAVLWWQLKNHEKFDSEIPQLLEWNGEYWGTQSINALN